MDAITKLNREIREPLTNFTVNDYGDLIRFLYFVYRDMVKGEDDSRFRRQVTCIGYFFSLAVTDDVLQKSDVIRVIAINNCENPNMPGFIKDFKEFASSHGYNFGSNWTNLYQSLASRSEIIFDATKASKLGSSLYVPSCSTFLFSRHFIVKGTAPTSAQEC